MQCDNCLIDMRVKEVKNEIFTFECVKCGKKEQKKKEELIAKYNQVNKEAK